MPTVAVSVMRYSASAFGFAFDAILDVLSSAIVLWRYSNAAAVHSAHREYILSNIPCDISTPPPPISDISVASQFVIRIHSAVKWGACVSENQFPVLLDLQQVSQEQHHLAVLVSEESSQAQPVFSWLLEPPSQRACVILGVIFLLSSICIVVKAIHDLSTRLLPEVDDFLFSVSILSGILCSVLAVLKFMLGKVLTSRALITDGFNSLVGGVMGFSILLSAEVFKHNARVWYLDGSIGVLIGLTIFAYGVKLLVDMVPRVRQTRHYEMFE
ncbi:transmembrane protein 163 [Cricetulus griseus]